MAVALFPVVSPSESHNEEELHEEVLRNFISSIVYLLIHFGELHKRFPSDFVSVSKLFLLHIN